MMSHLFKRIKKVFFGAKENNNGTIRIRDNGVYNEELLYTFNTSG